MSDQEVLQKAIEIAVGNGYGKSEYSKDWSVDDVLSYDCCEKNEGHVLFSHDFAKCLWGEDIVCIESVLHDNAEKRGMLLVDHDYGDCLRGHLSCVAWQYHMQRMVLEENPLQYEPLTNIVKKHI